jgi:hypothetical protein
MCPGGIARIVARAGQPDKRTVRGPGFIPIEAKIFKFALQVRQTPKTFPFLDALRAEASLILFPEITNKTRGLFPQLFQRLNLSLGRKKMIFHWPLS